MEFAKKVLFKRYGILPWLGLTFSIDRRLLDKLASKCAKQQHWENGQGFTKKTTVFSLAFTVPGLQLMHMRLPGVHVILYQCQALILFTCNAPDSFLTAGLKVP